LRQHRMCDRESERLLGLVQQHALRP